MKAEKLERTVTFKPAFDKRDPNPNKNCGIGSVIVRFILKGEKGAVQFVLMAGWHLPHVQDELIGKCKLQRGYCSLKPIPADLGYHSPTPQYEGQLKRDCDVLGGECYYDGSGLQAEPVFKRLLNEGDAGVWAALTDYYNKMFVFVGGEE